MSCNAIDNCDLPAIGIWIVSAVGTTTGENCNNRTKSELKSAICIC